MKTFAGDGCAAESNIEAVARLKIKLEIVGLEAESNSWEEMLSDGEPGGNTARNSRTRSINGSRRREFGRVVVVASG